jgi:hypothetical protein
VLSLCKKALFHFFFSPKSLSQDSLEQKINRSKNQKNRFFLVFFSNFFLKKLPIFLFLREKKQKCFSQLKNNHHFVVQQKLLLPCYFGQMHLKKKKSNFKGLNKKNEF